MMNRRDRGEGRGDGRQGLSMWGDEQGLSRDDVADGDKVMTWRLSR
jgi:hypothetical protein